MTSKQAGPGLVYAVFWAAGADFLAADGLVQRLQAGLLGHLPLGATRYTACG